MVRRNPLDFNPSDVRPGNILKDLAYQGLRKLGNLGVKKIRDLTEEISPSLDNIAQDESGIQRTTPFDFGDARKLETPEEIDYQAISNGLTKILGAKQAENSGDQALPNPSDIINQANERSIPQPATPRPPVPENTEVPEIEMTPLQKQMKSIYETGKPLQQDLTPYRGRYMHAGMSPEERELVIGANTVERTPEQRQETARMNAKYYDEAGMPIPDYIKQEMGPEEKILTASQAEFAKGMHPGLKKFSPEYQAAADRTLKTEEKKKEYTDKINNGLNNPFKSPVNGAADDVLNDPEKTANFAEIIGIDAEKSPEVLELVRKYEEILDPSIDQYGETITALDDESSRIKQRLDKGEATTEDKIMIGLALLLPAIAGGLLSGSSAGAAMALGAGGNALIKELTNQRDDTREQEKRLSDIAVKKGDLVKGKAELEMAPSKFKSELVKNLKKEGETGLEGMKRVTWTDQKTGESKEGLRILPGLIAKPEYVADKEDKKEMKKVAREINDTRRAVKEINDLSSDVFELASKVKESDRGLISKWTENLILGRKPDLKPLMGQTVEFNGRKVNLAVALEDKLALLVDSYRQAKDMRALTGTVSEHIGKVLTNPIGTFQTYDDLITQMLYLRDLTQKRLNNYVQDSGFYPEWISRESSESNRKVRDKLSEKDESKEFKRLTR